MFFHMIGWFVNYDGTTPSTFTPSFCDWFIGHHWNFFRYQDRGDMHERACNLGIWEHETFRFSLCGQKLILDNAEGVWIQSWVVIYWRTRSYCALFIKLNCTVAGQPCTFKKQATSTSKPFQAVSSSGFSRDTAWSVWWYKKKNA
jgi:hypothetical protein